MPYHVVLAKNAKVNGKRYKAGQTAENVSQELFEELQERWLVADFTEDEEMQSADELPEYKSITGAQIKERLTELNVDHEAVEDKKDLYALLEEAIKKEGE